MNQTDEEASTATLAHTRTLSLPEFMRQTLQSPPDDHPRRLPGLDFLRSFHLPGKGTPKEKTQAIKAKKHVKLPSGLTIEKTLEVVGGLETALNRFKPGATPYPALAPSEIQVTESAAGLQVLLAGREAGQEPIRQREIAKLFYWLATGQEIDSRSPDAQLRQLAQNYPHTSEVLRQGWQDGYSSTRQLGGAFGWSLFRWEHLPLSDAQIEAARQAPPKPVKPAQVKQLELPLPTDSRATNKSGFPALLAVGSLAVGLALIVAFLVISAANPPVVATTPTKAAPTPSPVPSPTAPLGLTNTRQADGAALTRLNPAYLSADQQKYFSPDSLAPGQAALLSGQRSVRVVDAQWSLGQNVYLGLQDGGWEVWDTASNNRLSRRELPDMDQYAWVNWSPDGENFAAQGYDGKLRLGTSGRVLRTFAFNAAAAPGDAGFPLSWSPGSNILMIRTEEATYQFWNFQGGPQPVMTADNKQTLNLKAESNFTGFPGIWSWSGDSRYIAFFMGSAANSINIYDTRSLAKTASITMDWQSPQQASEVYSDQYNASGTFDQGNFAWSPDNRYMALQRWNRNTSATTGDGSPLFQRTLTIFELPSNLLNRGNSTPVVPPQFQVIKLDSPDSSNMLKWSRDDRLVVNSRTKAVVNNVPVVRQNNLQVFDLDVSDKFNWSNSYKLTIPGQPEEVNAWWAPDGRRLLVNAELSYLVVYQLAAEWERTPNVQIRPILSSQDNPVEMAVPSPDSRWLATYSQKTGPQLRDFKTGELKRPLRDNYSPAASVALKWSPDSQYLAIVYSWLAGPSFNNYNRTVVRIWDMAGDAPKAYGDLLIPANGSFASKVEWNQKNASPQLIFEQNQDTIGSWDLTYPPPGPLADQEKQLFPGKIDIPINLPIKAGSQPTQTLTFNLVGKMYSRSNNPNFWLAPRAWFPDWQAVVGPLDNTHNYGILKVESPNTGKTPGKVQFNPSTEQKPEKAFAKAVAVSPDGRMVALGFDNGLVQLYDAANGKLFQAFTAHQGAIRALTFSADSKTLATAADDRTVKVWDTATWKPKAVLRGQDRPVTFLQWVNNSNTLLVVGSSAVMWRVS